MEATRVRQGNRTKKMGGRRWRWRDTLRRVPDFTLRRVPDFTLRRVPDFTLRRVPDFRGRRRCGAGPDGAAGAGSSVGDESGEVYSAPARGEPERLNTRNYRITAEDRLGEGSLKQKWRDNFAAIELVRKLDAEERPAPEEEKRARVKDVGWGGIPQVFAWHEGTDWQAERDKLSALLTAEA